MKFDKFKFDVITAGIAVGDYVYLTIKSNIINWNLTPGMRISEKEISEVLQVSRTPVREAFIKLSKEGLLEVVPQRGTYISHIDLDQVEEARFIRKSLESAVIELAIKDFPKEYLAKIEKNLEKQRKSVESKDYVTFFELDEEFHRLIYQGCNKERTWEVVEMVNTQYKRIRMLSLINEINFQKILSQHDDIYEAILENNYEKGKKSAEKHLNKLLIDLEALKEKYPDYFI